MSLRRLLRGFCYIRYTYENDPSYVLLIYIYVYLFYLVMYILTRIISYSLIETKISALEQDDLELRANVEDVP